MNLLKRTYLADYFSSQPNFFDGDQQKKPHIRKCMELPFQQTKAQLWDELECTLCDPEFLYAKCVCNSIYAVLRDLVIAQESIPEGEPARLSTVAVLSVIDLGSHLIGENPQLLMQQLYNALIWDWDAQSILGASLRRRSQEYPHTWFKQLNRPITPQNSVLMRIMPGHNWDVIALFYSLDGKLLLSCGERDGIKIWDAVTGELVCSVQAGAPIALHPSGQSFACAGSDGNVEMRDIKTGIITRRFQHCQCRSSLAFSPDGNILASGGQGNVSVWDFHSEVVLHSLDGQTGEIPSVTFSPNGSLLAAVGGGYGSHDVVIWNVRTGKERYRLHGHTDLVLSVAFSSDGTHIVSGSRDLTLRLWDLLTGDAIVISSGQTEGLFSVTFSRTGDLIASGSRDGTFGLFDGKIGHCKCIQPSHMYGVRMVSFSPSGDAVATGGMYLDSTIRVWNVHELVTRESFLPSATDSPVKSAVFSPNGRTLASIRAGQHVVELWNLDTNSVHRIAGKKEEVATCLAFLPDSRWLIKGGADGSLSLLDTWGEKQSVDLPRLTDVVSTMAISPDGSMFVAGGVYSGNNIGSLGQRSWSCELHDQSGIALAYVFSSDGRTLAIGTENPRQIGSLSLVNAHTGDVMEVLLHDARAVTSVAFSPEGRFVAAGVDSDVQVWDSYRKERLHLLRGHHHAVILLAFSSNGRVLASGSSDKTIRLWDINTGNLLSVFPCENRPLSIWFNPELPQLLVASLQDSHLMPIIHMLELGNMSFSVTA